MPSKKHNNEVELQKSKDGKVHYAIQWLAGFSIRNKGYKPTIRSLCQAAECLERVALAATSDVQSILEIPATDEIHMEDRNHGLA